MPISGCKGACSKLCEISQIRLLRVSIAGSVMQRQRSPEEAFAEFFRVEISLMLDLQPGMAYHESTRSRIWEGKGWARTVEPEFSAKKVFFEL